MQFETILVERPDPRVARIVMNRPEARNAQNLQMTYDLNAAFDQAVQDDAVKVIILAGNGPHFSSGHDLRPGGKNTAGVDFPPVGNWGGFAEPNAHGRFAREQEIYLQITRRWRNLGKPTIAEVHGKCIAGGLMLAWACDFIVASDDAEFCDPVVTMGVCGVEWFVHPWELGPRKAKETAVHRRWLERRRSAPARHGQSCRAARGPFDVRAGASAKDRGKARFRAEADQGGGQPLGRRDGPASRDRAGLCTASALPRA